MQDGKTVGNKVLEGLVFYGLSLFVILLILGLLTA